MKEFRYTLEEDEYKKIEVVFDTFNSRVHGFSDTPPTKWSQVYKIYMSWKVEEAYKKGLQKEVVVLYNEACDENSGLDMLSHRLKAEDTELDKHYRLQPISNDTHYLVHKYDVAYREEEDEEEVEPNYVYEIIMYDSYNGNAFRVLLYDKEAKELAKTIDDFYEYMLEHSVGI